MDDSALGLYNKYRIYVPATYEGDVHNYDLCEFFVLDLNHDCYAFTALSAYVEEWQKDHPETHFFPTVQPTFRVERTRPSAKHKNCQYFVLDTCHDRYAIAALRCYKWLCLESDPMLANDLIQLINRHEGKYNEHCNAKN